MDLAKNQLSNAGCKDTRKLEVKNGFEEFDILRNAYELLLENSQFFWEELTIAFTIESERAKLT